MEAQRRGASHFHLIVLGPRFVPHEWVHDPRAKGRTETKRVGSYKQAMAYVSKYVSKCQYERYATTEGKALAEVGRVWGVMNRTALTAVLYCVRGLAARGRLLSRLAWATGWEQLLEWPIMGGGVVYVGLSHRVIATVLNEQARL